MGHVYMTGFFQLPNATRCDFQVTEQCGQHEPWV